MNRYDFLVVGGGPVGCRSAYTLAKAGYQVAVLEKKPSVGQPVCCTGIVSLECLKRFEIPFELILKELNSASMFSPAGRLLRLERSEVQAAVLDRGAFNAHMARRAQDERADYLLGHNVTGIQIYPDGVATTVNSNGKSSVFEGRAVVLACGFGTRLTEKLGFGKALDWVVGAQVEVEALNLPEVEVYLGRNVAPGYFAWLVPAGGSTALAGLMTRENADGCLVDFLASLKGGGKINSVTGKACFRGITMRPPARCYANRVLVVGDAAGQIKPLTGGGIYFGLLCADLAAGTLRSAMEAGDFSSSRLSAYQKEWKRLLGSELRLGRWAHNLFSQMSDKRIDWAFDIALKRHIPESLASSDLIGFDWHGRAMLQLLKQAVWPPAKLSRLDCQGSSERGIDD